jgi:hypothetical protein
MFVMQGAVLAHYYPDSWAELCSCPEQLSDDIVEWATASMETADYDTVRF